MTRFIEEFSWVILFLNLTGCQEDPPDAKVEATSQAQVSKTQALVFEKEESAPACGELKSTGSPVLPEEVEGAPREAVGGEIQDGIYRVAAYRVFGKIPELENVPFHQTAQFLDGGSALLLVREAAGKVQVTKYKVRASAETMELTGSCPESIAGSKSAVPYSSEDGRLSLQIDRTDGLRTEIVYERTDENQGGSGK